MLLVIACARQVLSLNFVKALNGFIPRRSLVLFGELCLAPTPTATQNVACPKQRRNRAQANDACQGLFPERRCQVGGLAYISQRLVRAGQHGFHVQSYERR